MFSKFFQNDFIPNELHKLKKEIQEKIKIENRSRKKKQRIIDLTLSNPTLCGFDYSIFNLEKIFSHNKNYTYKPSSSGTEDLRTSIKNYYIQRFSDLSFKYLFSENNLFFTSGTSESYSHIFKVLCNPGESVLIPKPGYPLIYYIARINNFKVVYYNLNYKNEKWEIDFNSLLSSVSKKTKCIVAINPNNPTGNYIKKDEFLNLISICQEKNLPLIIDEVFFDYRIKSENSITLDYFKTYNIPVFILNGLSKIAALPQMKLGWIYFTADNVIEEKIRMNLDFICDTYLSVNTPIINATSKILKYYKSIQEKIKNRIKSNLDYLQTVIENSKNAHLLSYEGGWYAVVKFKTNFDDDTLSQRILKEKYIFIYPGYFYDFKNKGYLILSLIIQEKDFKEGIEKILQFFN